MTDEPKTEAFGPLEADKEKVDAGVLVRKHREGGKIGVSVETQGGVESTEVLTLLELAIEHYRAQLGLYRS